MEGIRSLNTNPMTNTFCQLASQNDDTICSSCYARSLCQIRPNMQKAYDRNATLLSEQILKPLKLEDDLFRFNSFGELINETHVQNLLNIVFENPNTNFALWTKKPNLLKRGMNEKPKNLQLVYSSIYTDKIANLPDQFDKVFTVFSKEQNINCSEKCIDCQYCYHDNNIKYIRERRK